MRWMVTLRRATAADAAFIQQMLVVAADWRPGRQSRTVAEVMSDPSLAHYAADWPRAGDVGVIAEADVPVGGAWWRFFAADDPGYGFVDSDTPEVSIGVHQAFRGQGTGRRLLETLIAHAVQGRVPALSLSVEPDNYAVRLYRRLGFEVVEGSGGSLTMLLRLPTE
jgi:ribosomal protein S18 acetylase RimI-like enzyme